VSDVQGISGSRTDPLRQKFTTKEFDEEGDENGAPGIKAYYFGARYYDPELSVWLSCDPAGQFANAYGYANNPIIMADADGELAWFVLPMIIGALAGAYGGGVAANGSANPADWDFSSGKTWGYMLGGAVIGGASGVLGGAVAGGTTVLPYTGLTVEYGLGWGATAGTIAGSTANSLGMWAMTGGKSDISTSLGAVSFNWSAMARGEDGFGYLGKEGNSGWENFGYALGALGNLSDLSRTQATLYTEKGNAISHSAIVDDNFDKLMSYGPNDDKINGGGFKDQIVTRKPFAQNAASYKKFGLALRKGTSEYGVYYDLPVKVNVNKYAIGALRGVTRALPFYQGISLNCVNMASISLWLSGIPNIGLHPYILYATTNFSTQVMPHVYNNSYFLY
jgi:RHS repeat-associated protein